MPVNQDACRLGISTLLQQELELAERFETLLGDEYRVIARRDIAALEQLIGDKARLLEQLAGLEQERTALLKGAGFETGHPGMTHCLRWCDPQQQITPLWQRLQSQARICDDLTGKTSNWLTCAAVMPVKHCTCCGVKSRARIPIRPMGNRITITAAGRWQRRETWDVKDGMATESTEEHGKITRQA